MPGKFKDHVRGLSLASLDLFFTPLHLLCPGMASTGSPALCPLAFCSSSSLGSPSGRMEGRKRMRLGCLLPQLPPCSIEVTGGSLRLSVYTHGSGTFSEPCLSPGSIKGSPPPPPRPSRGSLLRAIPEHTSHLPFPCTCPFSTVPLFKHSSDHPCFPGWTQP